jgi:hypothetical protein
MSKNFATFRKKSQFKFYLVAKSLRRVAKNRELVIFTTVQVICWCLNFWHGKTLVMKLFILFIDLNEHAYTGDLQSGAAAAS